MTGGTASPFNATDGKSTDGGKSLALFNIKEDLNEFFDLKLHNPYKFKEVETALMARYTALPANGRSPLRGITKRPPSSTAHHQTRLWTPATSILTRTVDQPPIPHRSEPSRDNSCQESFSHESPQAGARRLLMRTFRYADPVVRFTRRSLLSADQSSLARLVCRFPTLHGGPDARR